MKSILIAATITGFVGAFLILYFRNRVGVPQQVQAGETVSELA